MARTRVFRGGTLTCFLLTCLLAFAAPLFQWATAMAAEDAWPRRVDTPNAVVTMYQPQLESISGDRLASRAAVSVKSRDKKEPVFGVVWMDARMNTDRNTRTVTFEDIRVKDVRFPEGAEDQKDKIKDVLEKEMAGWKSATSLDRIVTAVESMEREKSLGGNYRNTPPKIIFIPRPAVLVLIDGEPRLIALEKTKFMRVANTPFLIVYDPVEKIYYLRGGTVWLSASDVRGPWNETESIPAEVKALAQIKPEEKKGGAAGKMESPLDARPELVVSTEPAELIASDGEPQWSTITGTNLLFMSNTESNVFLDTPTQQVYALLSGRWFSTRSLTDGPWFPVDPGNLPTDFAKIPPNSIKGFVLVSVAGTTQAQDAVAETYIPQTAVIDRKTATTDVKYDGVAKFEPIEGTNLEYAVNTGTPTFKEGTKYYAVESGVWYEANSPHGPWTVCVSPPADVAKIPPSNPHYNVKYAKVYDYTDNEAYVGYTPGYTGSYVDNGTVVYGTGYTYAGYQTSGHYYPYPATYGYAATYNPYGAYWGYQPAYYDPVYWFTAAAVGVASAVIWASVWDDWYDHHHHQHYYHHGGWGWWGNGGYNYVNIHRTHARINNINWDRPVYSRGGRWSGSEPPSGGLRTGRLPGMERPTAGLISARPNLYDRPGMSQKIVNRDGLTGTGRGQAAAGIEPGKPGTRPSGDRLGREPARMTRPAARDVARNNVLADRDGNVYRKDARGNWQRRDQGKWTDAGSGREPGKRVSRTPQASRGPDFNSLNRDFSSRYRGAERARNFNRAQSLGSGGRSSYSRPSGGGSAFRGSAGSRGGGAARGGGGRGAGRR